MGNTNGTGDGSNNNSIYSIEPRSATGNEIQNVKIYQRRIQEQYDPNNTSHVKILQRIWKLASFEGPFSQKNDQWQLIGFQGDNPISDLRGGGMLALDSILYHIENKQEGRNILKKRTDEYLIYVDRIQKLQSSKKSPMEKIGLNHKSQFFPFAAAGINITRVLAEELHIVDASGRIDPCAYNNLQKERFWHIFNEKNLFYELYSWTFHVLDSVWEEEGDKNYMAFSRILSATRIILHSVLNNPSRDSRFPIPRHLLPIQHLDTSTPISNTLSSTKRIDKRLQLELDEDLNPSISSNHNEIKESYNVGTRSSTTNYYDFNILPSADFHTKSDVNDNLSDNSRNQSEKTFRYYPDINPSTKRMKANPEFVKTKQNNIRINQSAISDSFSERKYEMKISLYNNDISCENSDQHRRKSSVDCEKMNGQTSTNPFDIYDIHDENDNSSDFNPFETRTKNAARVI